MHKGMETSAYYVYFKATSISIVVVFHSLRLYSFHSSFIHFVRVFSLHSNDKFLSHLHCPATLPYFWADILMFWSLLAVARDLLKLKFNLSATNATQKRLKTFFKRKQEMWIKCGEIVKWNCVEWIKFDFKTG